MGDEENAHGSQHHHRPAASSEMARGENEARKRVKRILESMGVSGDEVGKYVPSSMSAGTVENLEALEVARRRIDLYFAGVLCASVSASRVSFQCVICDAC